MQQKSFQLEYYTSELDLLSTIASLQTTLPKLSQYACVSYLPNIPLHILPHSTIQSKTIVKIKIEKQYLLEYIKNLQFKNESLLLKLRAQSSDCNTNLDHHSLSSQSLVDNHYLIEASLSTPLVF